MFFFFLGIGHWLVKEDALQKAEAIAVLSGNFPARAMEAAKLYHEGYAKEIWLTHPGVRSDPLKQFGGFVIPAKQGIPAKAIHILESSILSTADELDVISAALQDTGSQFGHCRDGQTTHAARAHPLERIRGGSRQSIVHGVSNKYNLSRWRKTPAGTTRVLHEVLGMMNASAGLPVQTGIRLQRSVAENTSRDSQEQQPLKIQQPVDSD